MIAVQNRVTDTACQDATLENVLDRIKTGGKFKDQIESIRSEYYLTNDKDKYDSMKVELPVIAFGGTFSTRSKEGLKEASGLMILDFDHIKDDEFKDKLTELQFIYVAFYSVSGVGVKALVKIPVVKSDDEYKEYFSSIKAYFDYRFPNTVDDSGKDICRACFFSYDPDLYKNPNATVWNERIEKTVSGTVQIKESKNYNYAKIQPALNFIRGAVMGERHTKILKASRLVGGYVASGVMSKDEAERLLKQEAYNLDKYAITENYRAITDGLEHGLKDPLDSDLEKEIVDYEQYGKLYYTGEDVQEEVSLKYKEGISRGYYVGFRSLAELYSLKMGATTYIYGAPFAGKTQFWLEILMNCSKFYGMNHALFSPETGTAGDVYIELYEIYSGQDFYSDYGHQMSKETLARAKEFVHKHFTVVDPGDKLLSVDDFYIYVDLVERKLNIKIHTTCIDPWNELIHNFGETGRQDVYLEWTLGKIRQNAKMNNRHNAIITHITSQDKAKDKETGMMYFPVADFREVAGGQSWSRKGMSMISLWRPIPGMKVGEKIATETMVQVFIQKVKPKGVGKKGTGLLYYDYAQHGFYEDIDGQRCYSKPEDVNAKPVQQLFSYYEPEDSIKVIPQEEVPF